jgi:hypothetical protein
MAGLSLFWIASETSETEKSEKEVNYMLEGLKLNFHFLQNDQD